MKDNIKFGILLYIAIISTNTVLGEEINDSFISDTGQWIYYGNAHRDTINNYVVLTDNIDYKVGTIWLNRDIKYPFSIEFKYNVGGGTGADGFVFMFYKKQDYNPEAGGWLGFQQLFTSVPGYGIEFDNFYNAEYFILDPSSNNHISLIKNGVDNHLKYIDDSRTEDYEWHNAKITVKEYSVEVFIDGNSVLYWEGYIDKTYGGFGFGAGTGAFNNWHIIDDVKITILPYNVCTGSKESPCGIKINYNILPIPIPIPIYSAKIPINYNIS